MEINKLKDKVEFCLERYPETRNSDIKLTNAIWITFHKETLIPIQGQLAKEYTVKLTDLYSLPREDHIKRIRAKIQNPNHKTGYPGKYPPTEEKIAIRRGWLKEYWLEKMGYNTRGRLI